MSVPTPATFASAAASNGTGDGGSDRNTASGADRSRPRMNGSHTFRRPSQLNTAVSGTTRDSSATVQTPSSGVYLPPHMASGLGRSAVSLDNRYDKDQLLNIYKASSYQKDVDSLLTEGWAPGQATAAGGSWGRRDERDPNPGPEICWDSDGTTKPLSLTELTEEERDIFTSVNSLVKPPQPATKEGAQTPGLNGRKTSISQGTGSLTSRPGVRRRDTTESFSGNPLASPTYQRGGRDENPLASPPPSLMRRRTDLKDVFGSADVGKIDTSVDSKSPFGSLRRTATGPLSAGITGPSSPWANEPSSAGGFGRMGSFGILDQPGTPGEKKPGYGSLGGGSRFMTGLRRENDEQGKTRSSLGLLDRLAEESNPPSQRQSRIGHRGEPGRLDDEPAAQTGSAALGGDDHDESSLMQGSDLRPFHERISQQSQPRGADSSQQVNQGNLAEPMSPTDTNPYHSPEHERASMDKQREDDQDSTSNISQGYGQQRRYNIEQSDQGSRPGSTAPPRGMSGLGNFGSGFGGIGGSWSGQTPIGQAPPGRSPFGPEPLFSSLGDLGTPGAGGIFSPAGTMGQGSLGGPQRSKLGSLFPGAMQDQMRGQEPRQDFFGSIGQSNVPPRDTDSPAARSSRNYVDDLFQSANRGPANVSSPFDAFGGPFSQTSNQLPGQAGFSNAIGAPGMGAFAPSQASGPAQTRTPDNDSQLPASQIKTMVMPDRMRWIYRDPQGNTQGPWSGLEMHDWYKAGFFSPELQVKKLEDGDYEPLAQLIRRIGNSREPFLVPQIGIPHGSSMSGAGAGVSGVSGPPAPGGNIQPPFANAFPSFGTTLTAEQQNALERRKQEEQYLMAQQKEYLQARQQNMRTQLPFQGPSSMHQGQLQHHSSAHSLQSQPSFGSIGNAPFQGAPGQTSHDPFGMPRPQAGGFGPVGPMQSGMQQTREDELASGFDRLGLGRTSQSPFAGFGGPMMQQDPSAVNQMLQDRGRLQQEQLEALQRSHRQPQDPFEGLDRLGQFHDLRQGEAGPVGVIGKPQGQAQTASEEHLVSSIEHDEEESEQAYEDSEDAADESTARPGMLSMPSKDVTDVNTTATEDVPPAQSAWAVVEKPQAHPVDAPAPSISPLPAPAAQRANRHVAEALAAENRSRSQTPSVETPSANLAPWAKETVDTAPRGPSLKEIQEIEARQAAEREAVLAQKRREALEQERLAQAAVPEPAPGLPSTASWAASGTPASPGASAWAKPAVGTKAAVGAQKKTLAQIQKEEEARKNRAAALATATAANTLASSTVVGKRYAELVGKTPQQAPAQATPAVGGAWTTVGSSGKTKAPGAVVTGRTVSGAVPTVSAASTPVKKILQPVRTTTMQSKTVQANEEVSKWARQAMGKGLHASINVDEFITNLMVFPLDVEIVSDSIYSASDSLDGRRLANEFVSRRKLAEKGQVPEGPITGASAGVGSSTSNNGGWSEVAKSKPVAPKEEPNASFKMVQGKKKQTKR